MMEGPMMPDNGPAMSNTEKILLLIREINDKDEEILSLKREIVKRELWIFILSIMLGISSITIICSLILSAGGA